MIYPKTVSSDWVGISLDTYSQHIAAKAKIYAAPDPNHTQKDADNSALSTFRAAAAA